MARRMVSYARDGDVVTIAMDDGKMNSFGFELLAAVGEALDRAEREEGTGSRTGSAAWKTNCSCCRLAVDFGVWPVSRLALRPSFDGTSQTTVSPSTRTTDSAPSFSSHAFLRRIRMYT